MTQSEASAIAKPKRPIKDPNPIKTDKRIVSAQAKVKNPDLQAVFDRLLKHKPTTDIIKEAEAAYRKGTILVKVLITVEMAWDLMSRNDPKKQRDLDFAFLQRYVRDHTTHVWKYNGENITLSKSGRLLNGQKRLLAIILSKVPQVYHVEWGLEDDNDTQDIGQARSIADVLKMMGIDAHGNTMSSAIKKIMNYKMTNRIKGNINYSVFSPADVAAWAKDKRNKVAELATYCNIAITEFKRNTNGLFSASEWGFLWYILANTNNRKDEAAQFIRRLADGQRIAKEGRTAPIFAARRYLEMASSSAKGKGSNQKLLTLKMQYAVRAWNDWVTQKRNADYSHGIKLDRKYIESYQIELPK